MVAETKGARQKQSNWSSCGVDVMRFSRKNTTWPHVKIPVIQNGVPCVNHGVFGLPVFIVILVIAWDPCVKPHLFFKKLAKYLERLQNKKAKGKITRRDNVHACYVKLQSMQAFYTVQLNRHLLLHPFITSQKIQVIKFFLFVYRLGNSIL